MNFLLQFPFLLHLCIMVIFSTYCVGVDELLGYQLTDRLEGSWLRFLVRKGLWLFDRLATVRFHLYGAFLSLLRSYELGQLVLGFEGVSVGFSKHFWRGQWLSIWKLVFLERRFLFQMSCIVQDLFFRFLRSSFGFQLYCFLGFENLLC